MRFLGKSDITRKIRPKASRLGKLDLPSLLIFAFITVVVGLNVSNFLKATNSEKTDQVEHSNLSANSTQTVQHDSDSRPTNSQLNVANQQLATSEMPQIDTIATLGSSGNVLPASYPSAGLPISPVALPSHPTTPVIAETAPGYARSVTNPPTNGAPGTSAEPFVDPIGSFDTSAPRLISSAQRRSEIERHKRRMELIAKLQKTDQITPDEIALLLKESIHLNENRRAITAKVTHRVNVLGYQMVGGGDYLEQRTIDKQWMRLELNLQIEDQVVSLIQACDGNFLWTYKSMPGSKELQKVDVAAVNAAWQSKSGARRAQVSARFEMMPSLGGLAKFLRALSSNFSFNRAQRDHWGSDKVSIWKIEGSILPGRLKKLAPELKEAIDSNEEIDLDDIPAQIPNYARFYIGQDDLFPYRIEYHRVPNPYANENEIQADRTTEIVFMQFYDVVFERPVDISRFDYQPPENVEAVDVTSTYINSLKR